MNAGMARTHESRFGPPSEPIDIAKFIKSVIDVESRNTTARSVFSSGDPIPQETSRQLQTNRHHSVASECSLSDIRDSLFEVWNNPKLFAHVSKSHELHVTSIHGSADSSRKPKRKRNFSDPEQEPPEVTALRKRLDAIQLNSWKLQAYSALFMRAPKNSDQNALLHVKQNSSDTLFSRLSATHEVIITVAVHNRLTWRHGCLYRASQHVLLASQTLGDLFEAIPCTSNALPNQIREDGLVEYEHDTASRTSGGCVMCVEGLAYGEGQNEIDYAEKLIAQVAALPLERRPVIKKAPTTMHDTPFLSLSLRINEPYWLLHQGNCEHFIVIDQIRLQHPSDPRSGYPLTVQITPPLLDLCRACTKIPAVWSVVGDVRLRESPCVLCEPCWRNMGDPQKDKVIVVPLPKHELG